MARWRSAAHHSVVLVLLCGIVGCQSGHPRVVAAPTLQNTVPASLQVPATVQRLAVLHPKTSSRELRDAYARLEGAAFLLKEQRPSLRIVDRSYLSQILDEQRFQAGGSVSDDTAIRIGRLLGVDSVLLAEQPICRVQVPWSTRSSIRLTAAGGRTKCAADRAARSRD